MTNYFPHAQQVVANLWLGSIQAAQSPFFLYTNRINVIINCSYDLPFPANNKYLSHVYRLPVNDDLQDHSINTMTYNLPRITQIIRHHHIQGHRILVHCYAGVQRSATVLTAYIMRYYTQGCLKSAIRLTRQARPQIFRPRCNFLPSLLTYQAILQQN